MYIDANRHYFDQRARITNKGSYMYTDQIQDMYNNIDQSQGTNKIK